MSKTNPLHEITYRANFARMKDEIPTKLSNRSLNDRHRKTHMLYGSAVKRKLPKDFINSIVDLHNGFVKEMSKRRMKHTTPLKKI